MSQSVARNAHDMPTYLRLPIITAAYLLAAITTRWLVELTLLAPGVSPWFPPAGLALAVAIRYGISYTPLIILGAFAARVTVQGGGFNLPQDAYYVLGIGVYYGIGGAAMRWAFGLDTELKRNRDIWVLLLGSVVLTGIAAFGAVSLSLPDEVWRTASWQNVLLHWWIGDAVGVMVMTPFLLKVLLPQAQNLGRWLVYPWARLQRARTKRGVELVLQCSATVVLALAVFTLFDREQHAMRYLCFIPLIWMAWRSGVPGAALGVTLFSFATIAALSSFGARPSNVLDVQLFTLLVGSAVLLLGAAVAQRQAAEQAHRRAEARLSDLMERAPVVIYARKSEPPHALTFVSGSAESNLGLDTRALLEDPAAWEQQVHPDDRAALRGFIATAMTQPKPFIEYRLRMPDGRYRWVRDVILNQPGDTAGRDGAKEFTGSLVDVHDSRVAEDALRESETMLSASQRIARVGGWSYDIPSGQITWTDETFRIFGRTPGPQAPSYEDHQQDIHPEDHDQYFGAFESALEDGQPFSHTGLAVRPDGSERHIESHGQPIRNEAGELVGFRGTVQDITQRVEAQREQARLQEELRQSQKLESMGTLATGVAHDVNNMLTAITGYAELARDKVPPGSDADDAIAMIEEVARQGTGVTRSMLTFGRRAPTHRVAADLKQLTEHSVMLLRRLLPASIHIDVHAHAPGDQLWARVDADQVQQVYMNLIINARDAMPDGGRIDIKLDSSAGEDDTRHVAVTVSDTGCGMDEQQVERAFEPFFTTKPRTKGTGLGLSLVHGIVTEHGGRIDVDTAPGRGSRFTITLPACTPVAEPQRPEPTPPDHGGGNNRKVILAEDNEFVRDVVAETLQSARYEVVAFADGQAAYEQLGEFSGYDLAVIDLDLPGLSGRDLINRLRELEADTPIILITGNREDTGSDQPWGVHLLAKPFTVTRLLSLADRLCRGRTDDTDAGRAGGDNAGT